MKYSAQSTHNMSLRAGHSVSDAKIGSAPAGQVMEGDELWTATADGLHVVNGDHWLHVLRVNGAPVDAWVAIVHNGRRYCALTTDDPTPPAEPVDVEIGKAIVTYRHVYADGSTGPWLSKELHPAP